jgi:hypothetical protein
MFVCLLEPGADPGFQVRGGAFKKIAPRGGRRENLCGISCEKSRFYAKKSYFFQLWREARKFVWHFVWKITILRKKIIFSSWIRPCYITHYLSKRKGQSGWTVQRHWAYKTQDEKRKKTQHRKLTEEQHEPHFSF